MKESESISTSLLTLKNVKNFLEGRLNEILTKNGLTSKVFKDIQLERQSICEGCPKLDRKKNRCSICRCSFPGLTFAPDKTCPINKWSTMTKHIEQKIEKVDKMIEKIENNN